MEPFQYQRHRMMDNSQNQFKPNTYNPTNMSPQILTPSNLNSLIHTTENTPPRSNTENYDYYSFTKKQEQKLAAPAAPRLTNAVPNIYPSDSATPSTFPTQNTPTMGSPMNTPQTTPRTTAPNNTPLAPPRMTSPNTAPQNPSRMTAPNNTPLTPPRMTSPNTAPQNPSRMTAPNNTPLTPPRMASPNIVPQNPSRMTAPNNTPLTPPRMTSPNGFSQQSNSNARMGFRESTEPLNIPYSNSRANTESNISNHELMQMNQNMTVPQPRLDSQTIVSTPPSSSLKTFKTLEECETAYEKDIKYLNNLNSAILDLLLIEIKKEFDLLDYDGSFIYDEYPDRNTLLRMAEAILERSVNMDIENESIEVTQYGRDDRNNRDHWLQYLIETLIFHELLERRRSKRRRGDRYYNRQHRNGRYY